MADSLKEIEPKARVLTAEERAQLAEAFLESLHFGPRYEVEGELAAPDGRRPQVRTVWQQDAGQVAPRLITAYPLESL